VDRYTRATSESRSCRQFDLWYALTLNPPPYAL
jgi:hypothetical protein